jgi:uncharacterized membrane protein
MSEESIVDYSRQKNVNRFYGILLIIFIAIGAVWLYFSPDDFFTMISVYMMFPIVVLLISAGVGALSKRAIDYNPGEWTKEKVWVTFEEYEEMVEKYEDSYGHLYARQGEGCAICGMMIIGIIFGAIIMFYFTFANLIFSMFVDGLLFVIILYLTVSIAGFVIGFRIPKIDATEFFKAPVKGDVTNFARELEEVPSLRVGLEVEMGVRAGVRTIIDAEVKTYVEGLPDTAQVRVQVSHSGFAYPYLVGTIYKGHPVKAKKEKKRLHTKYPPLFEYDMDGEVVVIVARFDIPSRTSSVPSISGKDFRALGALLAHELKDNYEKTQT